MTAATKPSFTDTPRGYAELLSGNTGQPLWWPPPSGTWGARVPSELTGIQRDGPEHGLSVE
eukprot:13741835-Alexandrium_andersonii.AAC.1